MTMEIGSHWQAEAEVDYDYDDQYPHVVVSRIKDGTTRKRLYERGADELDDREMDKMYKRDYWDDPAREPWLELCGLAAARAEAILCSSDRVLRATDAMLAQRWQEWEERRRSKADDDESEPPAPAGEGRRLFSCFWWRSIVDKIAALLRYFLG